MSIERLKQLAADQTDGDYVRVPGVVLADALSEANAAPVKGSLAEHVADRLQRNADAMMFVHRKHGRGGAVKELPKGSRWRKCCRTPKKPGEPHAGGCRNNPKNGGKG